MTYLIGKYHLPDHWYPSELRKRAKIDEYLHWHHTFLRRGAAITIFQKVCLASFPCPIPHHIRYTILKYWERGLGMRLYN